MAIWAKDVTVDKHVLTKSACASNAKPPETNLTATTHHLSSHVFIHRRAPAMEIKHDGVGTHDSTVHYHVLLAHDALCMHSCPALVSQEGIAAAPITPLHKWMHKHAPRVAFGPPAGIEWQPLQLCPRAHEYDVAVYDPIRQGKQ